ncbi:MAG: ABC transporter permease [Gemmatimonadota bacterium]|nr:ABC transporter permease [Gemmatimonadota bacterium]
MTGFGAFVGKELAEILRTWRIWVVPGMILFFGITSPMMALAAPALVSSIAGSQPGVTIQIPDAVARDAYLQFVKNLDQIVTFALIIAGAGSISGERRSGTAQLVLTKPLSRAGFVLAKLVSQELLLLVSLVVGSAACVLMTAVLFDGDSPGWLFAAVGWWLGFGVLVVALMTLFSVWFSSTGGAAGAGLAFFFVTLILRAWDPVASRSFVGLPAAAYAAAGGQPVFAGLPLATAGLGFLLVVSVALASFRRAEL